MNRRRAFLAGTGAAAVNALWSRSAAAAKVWRVGIFDTHPRGDKDGQAQRMVGAMRDLGYVEGRDIEYVHRYANSGSLESLRAQWTAIALELVRSRPDAIVCFSTVTTKAVQRATTTIPIVTNAGDPVGAGFAKSLVRPGGNITGVALVSTETYRKGFEHLKSIIPGDWALAAVYEDENRDSQSLISAVEDGARACAIPVRVMSFKGKTAEQAGRALASMRAQGIRVLCSWVSIAGIADEGFDLTLATKYGLATGPNAGEDDVAKGALMSYAPDGDRMDERKASQLARILRGTPPGEIPFEMPTNFRMVINRKTAKILGLTIPSEVLLLAEKVYD